MPEGEVLLTDEQLLWLLDGLTPLATSWRQQSNEGFPEEQGRLSLVLDMELKFMDGAWPAMLDGSTSEDRIIMKQVRTLDRAMRVPPDLQELPVPRDVLEVASLIQRRVCVAKDFSFTTHEVVTDASYASLLPYDLHPFLGQIALTLTGDLSQLGLESADEAAVLHTQLIQAHPLLMEGSDTWSLDAQLSPEPAATLGLSRIVGGSDGSWSLESPMGTASGQGLSCQVEDLMVMVLEQEESHRI